MVTIFAVKVTPGLSGGEGLATIMGEGIFEAANTPIEALGRLVMGHEQLGADRIECFHDERAGLFIARLKSATHIFVPGGSREMACGKFAPTHHALLGFRLLEGAPQ